MTMPRFRPKRAVLAVAVLAALAGCGRREAPPRVEEPVVRINRETVGRDAYQEFVAVRMGTFGNAALSPRVQSQLFDEFVTRRILLQAARERGITATAGDLPAIPDDTVRESDPAADTPARIPAEARERERLADLTVRAYLAAVAGDIAQPTRNEVTQYYEQHRDRYQRTGFYLREIRVDSRELIDELARKLAQSPVLFAELARKHSLGPNGSRGGLSYYDRGQLPAEIEEPVLALRPGEISRVVKTGFGFHLFKLERLAEPLPLQSLQDEIFDEMIAERRQERFEAETRRLQAAASVEIFDSVLGFAYAGTYRKGAVPQ